MIGEESHGEEHEGAKEPSSFHEGVREAEYSRAHDGYEDVGEGLGLGGEAAGLAQKWGVLSG